MVAEKDQMAFETLTSIYRVEKGANTLSNVRKDLYSAMTELLEEQTKECDRLASTNPESIMYDGASERKKKISQFMKRIIELRMDKISALALRGAMGAVNTVESLTAEEKEYYNAILDASKKHWSLIDKKRKNTYIPDIAPEPIRTIVKTAPEVVIPRTLNEMPVIEDVPEDIQEQEIIEDIQMPEEMSAEISSAMDFPAETSIRSPAETHVETQIKNMAPEPENEETVILRVLENLPAFSGPDRDYDLKKEDIVRLPAVMA
ncbi:MAG: hypothetical protein WCR96_05520, partial [Candidatus Methanomethylophilaceae archaeon]